MNRNGPGLKGQSHEEVFNIFYKMHHKQVYYSAYKITKDRFLAQDVVQETFIKAFSRIDELCDENIQRAWLIVTSRNTAIDMYRKRLRRFEILDNWSELHAGKVNREIELFAEMEYIRELLLTIEPLHRQALLLIYEYGLTYEQLASYQKSSVNAVKSRIHRAKLKMRSMIQVLGIHAEGKYIVPRSISTSSIQASNA